MNQAAIASSARRVGQTISRRRLPLMVLAILCLLLGLWAGLIRIGMPWTPLRPTLPMAHGPLMIGGFLGALIGLERAVALGKPWAYFGPVCSGAGALLVAFGIAPNLGVLLILIGSLNLVLVMTVIGRLQPALFTIVIASGAIAWAVGNLLWLFGFTVAEIVLWWAGFLVLTITGERLELSRILRLSQWSFTAFGLSAGVFVAGLILSMIDYALGMRLAGLGMVLLALWLWRYDIARRRLKAPGQARYMAICLISGFVWLGIGGLFAILYGGVMAGPRYDAILHAIFLGFVFTMIFAHALIVFPAVLDVAMIYSPRFYSHLILLHLTLALRIAGDLLLWWPGRVWGGLLNAIVLLLFLGNTVTSIRPRNT